MPEFKLDELKYGYDANLYPYDSNIGPSIKLKAGQEGTIVSVDLDDVSDTFRDTFTGPGNSINFSLPLRNLHNNKRYLQNFNDYELEKLAELKETPIYDPTGNAHILKVQLPLEELKQIRRLQIYLREKFGDDYRNKHHVPDEEARVRRLSDLRSLLVPQSVINR